jgi:hypothetical protein
VSVNTQEAQVAPSPIEHLQRTELFMQRLRDAGLNSVLEDIFANSESTVPMEELAAAARKIVTYRYATVTFDSYEPVSVFGRRFGYNAPYDPAHGRMLVDPVSGGSRGMPREIGTDWSPLAKNFEAKIVHQDRSRRWGNGAHTITIRVRTLRPASGR